MTAAEKILKEKEAQKQFEELQDAFSRIMKTNDGKKLEKWLKTALTAPSYEPGLSYDQTAFGEGQRHTCRELLLMAKSIN